MEGFFAGYLTGRAGMSVILFAVKDGRLIGVDMGGIKYDGQIRAKADGIGFSCRVSYTMLPGIPLITGAGPMATPTEITLNFDLPLNFAEGIVIGIETPTGPLNAKFTKLRDFELG
jgi:hypothetical protein